jgi:hypothetical protein
MFDVMDPGSSPVGMTPNVRVDAGLRMSACAGR